MYTSPQSLFGPLSFFGHRNIWETLLLQFKAGRLPHALLFQGPQGVGKRRVAQELACTILNFDSEGDKGRSLIMSGNHPDLHVLSRPADKKSIPTETVREFIGKIQLQPFIAKHSVCIIDEAHEMNASAANALLKTLEEPPSNCIIILVTSASHRMLETIISRCQLVTFGDLTDADLGAVLESIASYCELDSNLVSELYAQCAGNVSALDLSDLTDPVSLKFAGGKAAQKHLKSLADKSVKYKELISSVFSSGKTTPAECISAAIHLLQSKDESKIAWNVLRSSLRQQVLNPECGNQDQWAQLFLDFLDSEAQISERNLSAQLHISTMFLKAHEICNSERHTEQRHAYRG